jgi:hypothetical protein
LKQVIVKRNGLPSSSSFKLNVPMKQECSTTRVVDTFALEAQMDTMLEWKLSEIGLGQGTPDQAKTAKEYLRHFLKYYPDKDFVRACVDSNFERHSDPVSMMFEDEMDLLDCVGIVYQLMYFHYFLGRHYRLEGNFPSFCCGISSRNLTLSLWEVGIFAAISTYDDRDDHAYVIIPYQMSNGTNGVILADPTSDQLHRDRSKKVRNHIALLPPNGWQYRTDWRGGSDLYPLLVQLSSCLGKKDIDYPKYILSALQNGARLEIKPPT